MNDKDFFILNIIHKLNMCKLFWHNIFDPVLGQQIWLGILIHKVWNDLKIYKFVNEIIS